MMDLEKAKDMRALHANALLNTLILVEKEGLTESSLRKIVFHGVKTICFTPINKDNVSFEDFQRLFQIICYVKDYMSRLTPSQFVAIFPIEKKYDGEKWECEDFFSTVEYLNTLDTHSPIGDMIDDLLWEYTNSDIRRFNITSLVVMDMLRVFDGKCSMAEEWAAEKEIKTLSLRKDSRGKKYIYDKDARKTFPMRKPAPRHLKVLK